MFPDGPDPERLAIDAFEHGMVVGFSCQTKGRYSR
jgi:hypothetical protein